VVNIKIVVFWVVILCSLVATCQCLRKYDVSVFKAELVISCTYSTLN